MIKAIFAGSFDPVTNGHLDIVERSLKICDKLIVAIGINSSKKTLISLNKRKSLIIESVFALTSRFSDIEIDSFDGLLVNYAKEKGATLLIRGVRSVLDFEYETALANANKLLAPEIETVFIPTKPELSVISSSMVKEVDKWNGDISKFVPQQVVNALKELK